ncbi:hypothetical protein [Mycobacterium avium]|uniref:Uncharacterized protein n=1 Tax=Mycobacterium avium subsp. hominissuis TaxID=439334 RepID=A0AAI8X5G7_MYCAV|nr:hypothetical protein [Mycobacterium avium]PBA08646.1 hypothetical protein CKJ70_25305 [Mycobacterium avium]BBN50823.1 hypothetical protein JPH1_52980 [Mycobacterium avium subsp. hominissuis]
MKGVWESPLAVQVEAYGLQWVFGPLPTLPAAMEFVSEHVWDTDTYRHQYLSLIDPSEAAVRLNRRVREGNPGLFDAPGRSQQEPLEVALRAAIAREHGGVGDGPHGDGLYAHLDIHRPWRVAVKRHACWEGDCDHGRDDEGNCTAPVQHAVWCRGCTPVYVSGGEFDGTPYDECQVDWPCSPVLAMCASFGVSLTGKALPTDRLE